MNSKIKTCSAINDENKLPKKPTVKVGLTQKDIDKFNNSKYVYPVPNKQN